jgi:hypothetical protein
LFKSVIPSRLGVGEVNLTYPFLKNQSIMAAIKSLGRISIKYGDYELVTGVNANGQKYFYHVIDEDKHLVKRVSATNLASFVTPDIRGLDEQSKRINTKLLYFQLEEKGFDPVLKGNNKNLYITCFNYRIKCEPYGFSIEDGNNFYKHVNNSEHCDDFPSVESVIKYLQKHKSRPDTVVDLDVIKPIVKLKTGETLNSDREIVTKVVTPTVKIKSLQEIVEDFTSYYKELVKLKVDYPDAVNRLKAFTYPQIDKSSIPDKERQALKVRLGYAFNKSASMETMFAEAITAFGKRPSKMPVPTFFGITFPEDLEYVAKNGDVVEYRYRVENVLITKKRKFWEIWWRQIIALDKSYMPYLMLIAKGEWEHNPKNLLPKDARLKFVEFDEKVLDNPANIDYFINCLEDYCGVAELHNIWDYIYDIAYPIGTKLKVYYPDFAEWYYVTLRNKKNGVMIQFADGTTDNLKWYHSYKKID